MTDTDIIDWLESHGCAVDNDTPDRRWRVLCGEPPFGRDARDYEGWTIREAAEAATRGEARR